MDDMIYRQAVLDLWEKYHPTIAVDAMQYDAELRQLPPASCSEFPNNSDTISRQAVKELAHNQVREKYCSMALKEDCDFYINLADSIIDLLPPAEPEHTCVNCGRTANNGGWYADGRTRCPIEEHYALPKDGYCHLWEKRNVTDDDYPERREE